MGNDGKAVNRLQQDQGFGENQNERRRHVRVVPALDQPVTFVLGDINHKVNDISPGGLSFFPDDVQGPSALRPGVQVATELRLPQMDGSLELEIEVLESELSGLVRCSFAKMDPRDAEDLSAYVDQRLQDILDKFM